jgi:hypothetical protein
MVEREQLDAAVDGLGGNFGVAKAACEKKTAEVSKACLRSFETWESWVGWETDQG